ncbi:hypothetical protein WJX74_006414 [Apatococcus lobatus]|uniref:Uncharacterized protein n=1 Tax=Apatococcus lobatus TaxID=904363 RepID=A0AAW1RBK4_9CHLO
MVELVTQLAGRLCASFASGQVDEATAAAVQRLVPSVSVLSLSIVAGGQVLITADNLAQPGYFQVYFYNVKTSLAGEAVLKGSSQTQTCSSSGSSKLQDVHQLQASSKCQLVVSLPVMSSSPQGLMPAAAISPTQAATVLHADPHDVKGKPYAEPKEDEAWPGNLGIGALTAGFLPADDSQLAAGSLEALESLTGALRPFLSRYINMMIKDLTSVFFEADSAKCVYGCECGRCEDAEDLAERQHAYGSPSDDEAGSWSESQIEALRSSLPPAEHAAAADLQSISDRSRDDSLEDLIRRDQLFARRSQDIPEEAEHRQSSSSLLSTLGNSTDFGSSLDGASSLRDQRDGIGPMIEVSDLASEGAQHLQEHKSAAESRRSFEVSRKAHSNTGIATRCMSGDLKNTHSDQEKLSDAPSSAESVGFSQLLSFQRGTPKGRCSCMLKRHFDERSRLSRDLGQEAAFTDSDPSFSDLMKSVEGSISPSSSLATQLSNMSMCQPSSELPSADKDPQDAARTPATISSQTVHMVDLGVLAIIMAVLLAGSCQSGWHMLPAIAIVAALAVAGFCFVAPQRYSRWRMHVLLPTLGLGCFHLLLRLLLQRRSVQSLRRTSHCNSLGLDSAAASSTTAAAVFNI